MKIMFISDIHSNLHALEEVLAYSKTLGIDEIICCGDIVGYNAFPRECVDIIRKNDIACVMGNHDWAAVTGDASGFNPFGVAGVVYSRAQLNREDLAFLKRLSSNIRCEKDGVSLFVVHGSPLDTIFEYVFPDFPDNVFESFNEIVDADVVVMGHTHIPMERIVGGTIFLNPGSVGQPRDGNPLASFMVFDTKDDKQYEWYRVVYDVKAAAEANRKKGLPTFLAERLYVGR